ncbi:MAG: ABC transporter permease subunit [Candidatus Anstonellales archaeon]
MLSLRKLALLFLIFIGISHILIGSETDSILYFLFRSFVRISLAYFFCVIVALPVALLITHSKRAKKFLFPIIDIGQSLPILTFMPFAFLIVINYFPFGEINVEIVSIFLLMTSMLWAIIYAFVEGINKIGKDIIDVASLYSLKGFSYIKHIVLPSSAQALVSASITSVGGGWYFVIAAEYLSFGTQTFVLPGIGSYMLQAISEMKYLEMGIALFFFIALVTIIQTQVWNRLLNGLNKRTDDIFELIVDMSSYFLAICERIIMLSGASNFLDKHLKPAHVKAIERITPAYLPISLFILLGIFLYLGFYDAHTLLTASFLTSLRIFAAYLISIFWTTAAALYLIEKRHLIDKLTPIFNVLQSVPAVSIFPLVALITINIFGDIGLELAAIILLMTGMQWYLIFNMLRAVSSIPQEYDDVGRLFAQKTLDRINHVYLPYLAGPALFASIEAIGGGWNATIVSEYIFYDGQPHYVLGLGSLLNLLALKGDVYGIIAVTLAMVLLVTFSNVFIWQTLINKLRRAKEENK